MSVRKIDGVDATNNLTKKFGTAWCSSTSITKGEVVVLDDTVTVTDAVTAQDGGGDMVVMKATAVANQAHVVGIAAETLTAKGYLKIQLVGANFDAIPDAAIALGKMIGTDNTTAGRIQDFVDATAVLGNVGFFARCINAFTGGAGVADGGIYIFDRGWVLPE
jgi:hypothetical protein